jgi:hypothetical protein
MIPFKKIYFNPTGLQFHTHQMLFVYQKVRLSGQKQYLYSKGYGIASQSTDKLQALKLS